MTLTRHRTYSVVAGMLLVAFAIALFAAGHGKAATTPTPPPAPEVSVIYVQGEDVATYREYPARTYARDLVDIRGRVDGYIEPRTFDIGSDVRAGQVLSSSTCGPTRRRSSAHAAHSRRRRRTLPKPRRHC